MACRKSFTWLLLYALLLYFRAVDIFTYDGKVMHYQNTQIGYVTISAGLVGLAVTYYSFMAEYGELGIFGFALMGFFAALTVLFATLTTEITGRTFRFYFGPGFWTREFPLEDIRSAEVVQNSAWHG